MQRSHAMCTPVSAHTTADEKTTTSTRRRGAYSTISRSLHVAAGEGFAFLTNPVVLDALGFDRGRAKLINTSTVSVKLAEHVSKLFQHTEWSSMAHVPPACLSAWLDHHGIELTTLPDSYRKLLGTRSVETC